MANSSATCSVVGCIDQCIFTHRVPSQAEIKSKLIDFIFDANAPAMPKKCCLFVCKKHFAMDSYENIGMVMPGFEGTWILKRRLGAIMPAMSLSTSSSQQENTHNQGYSTPPMLKVEECDESSSQQDPHIQCYSTPLMLKVEDPGSDKTDSVSSTRPGHLPYQRWTGLVGPSKQIRRSVGTQLSGLVSKRFRSKGSQTTIQPRVLTVSVAIGTPVRWKGPPPIQSSTFRKPFKPSKRRGLKQDDDHGVFTEPYIPGEPVSTETMLSQASTSKNDVPRYIVDEYCLLELFEDCPACGFACEVQKTIRGTFLAVHQMCLQCSFSRDWKSQQLEAVPSGDPRSCTSDPESSAAISEIIGFSDDKCSLDEGPSEDPETSVPAITEIIRFSDENDSSDEGSTEEEDHNSDSDWDPLQHHNIDDKLADSESDEDAGSESGAEEKHEKDSRKMKLCPECGAFFYKKIHTCENKKPYSCNMCGKRCLSESNLKAHKRIHKDGYKHECKYCLSNFRTRSDKLVHEQSHPPRRKPYQCPDCPNVFARMRERNDHLVSHRGHKRHICHVCNMEFSNVDQLQRHVAVHTKVKQFVCEVCQRSFTQSSHLKSHIRVHTGEKPYQCQHCDKSFNHNVSLKSHIQRYHGQVSDPEMKVQMETSRNEFEMERDETDEMESSAVDAEEAERSEDTLCNPEEEEEEEEKKVGKKRQYKPSGRPKGRPKRNAMVTSRSVSEVEKDDSNQKDSSAADVEEAKTDEMESSGVAVIISDDANQLKRVVF